MHLDDAVTIHTYQYNRETPPNIEKIELARASHAFQYVVLPLRMCGAGQEFPIYFTLLPHAAASCGSID